MNGNTMPQLEELIEKCRLTDEEIGKTFTRHQKSHPHHQWDSTGMFRAMADAKLRKAIPIVSAEVRKAERERIIGIIADSAYSRQDSLDLILPLETWQELNRPIFEEAFEGEADDTGLTAD